MTIFLSSTAVAATGYYKGEMVMGHTKVCMYETDEGGLYSVNMGAADQCPMTIEV